MEDKNNKPAAAAERLKERFATMSDLGAAASLMYWDQETYMPPRAVGLRSEQLATLSRLSHEMLVSSETKDLIFSLEGEVEEGSEEAALVRLSRREYERATKLPSELVEEIARTTSLAHPAWVEAREKSDWSAFAPHLKKIIALQKRSAECLGYEDHPYDALLDLYEVGVRKATLEPVFERLKNAVVPLLKKVVAAKAGERSGGERSALLRGEFPEGKQETFGREVLADLGYDWSRGRQDRVVHAFCIDIGGPDDVRLTTNFTPSRFDKSLFTSMHEAGHAMYEQNVLPAYARTPLGGGASMGVHESQSRLWENLVGRSQTFWEHYLPKLKETFPGSFDGASAFDLYRAVNEVEPGFIRIDADELTYNLHVLLRFELEVALLEGTLSVEEVPAAWNRKMEEYLGVTPPDDAMGALQDVHWSSGLFGYFPTYTLGNVLSVQFYQAALEAHPEIPEEISRGNFDALRGWLTQNVYRPGSRYDPEELVERATGHSLDTAPYIAYLENKFGELYLR